MKQIFTTLDLIVILKELRNKIIGLRPDKIYDVDKKTYYIKFQGCDKNILVIESGKRIHLTNFGWPKNSTPSPVTMKLRKNIGTARVELVDQLGYDRVVDLQFGSKEYSKHLIIELFDQGNLILTNHEYTIIMILRSRKTAGITVGSKYDISAYKQFHGLSTDKLEDTVNSAGDKDQVKRLFNPYLPYGITIFEHILLRHSLPPTVGRLRATDHYIAILEDVINEAKELFCELINRESPLGFIVHSKNSTESDVIFDDFIPYLFSQFESLQVTKTANFNDAVDLFYSNLENDKLTKSARNMEIAGRKKSEKIIADHKQRVALLKESQDINLQKAVLIEDNVELVDEISKEILRGLSEGFSWEDICSYVDEYSDIFPFDHVKQIKFESNSVTVHLTSEGVEPLDADIDMSISAFANARNYYQLKKDLVQKEQKTVNSTQKALESAQEKAKKSFKNAELVKTITKLRKPFWFEKFKWFISSDNLVVVAGCDQQQNELIVSRYLRERDIFVHADLSGAPVVVVKGGKIWPIPPRTLEEAGSMAVCLTSAWESKISVEAFWVYNTQVSKTPPSGEYLSTGSFMISGKKNTIPTSRLVYGFGIIFKTSRIEDIEKNDSLEIGDEELEKVENGGEVINELLDDVGCENENNSLTGEGSESEKISEDDDLWAKNDAEMAEFILSSRPLIPESVNIKPSQPEKTKVDKANKNWSKAKKRKFMKKYNDQDEHDRAVNMAILGCCGEPKERKNKKQERQQKAQAARLYHQKRLEERQAKAAAGDTQTTIKQEDNVKQPIECESLMSLTTFPDEEEELLYAIPVCAPYSALSNYKFKLKLVHGPVKRGKACKQALNILMNDKTASEVEKNMMKTLVDVDLSKSAPSCLKVVYKSSQFKKK